MVSKSTENLEETRPVGVLEKKEKGAPSGEERRVEGEVGGGRGGGGIGENRGAKKEAEEKR